MGFAESDHVIAYAVVTHPHPPKRSRNMLLGANDIQMDIIEAIRGYGWVTTASQSRDHSRRIPSGGPRIGQFSGKWPKIGGPPFFAIFLSHPLRIFYRLCLSAGNEYSEHLRLISIHNIPAGPAPTHPGRSLAGAMTMGGWVCFNSIQ